MFVLFVSFVCLFVFSLFLIRFFLFYFFFFSKFQIVSAPDHLLVAVTVVADECDGPSWCHQLIIIKQQHKRGESQESVGWLSHLANNFFFFFREIVIKYLIFQNISSIKEWKSSTTTYPTPYHNQKIDCRLHLFCFKSIC